MSDQEIRIAMAEVDGWTKIVSGPGFADTEKEYPIGINLLSPVHKTLPNYLHDLNAVHEVEKKLTHDQLLAYRVALMHACSGQEATKVPLVDLHYYTATARQRCEAILRCLGRWED